MSGTSKYTPLAHLLTAIGAAVVELTFADLDTLLPGGLPECAYRYRTWWTAIAGNSAQSRGGWLAAGNRVSQLDLGGERVTFTRSAGHAGQPSGCSANTSTPPARSAPYSSSTRSKAR